jgi:hypothetical protein
MKQFLALACVLASLSASAAWAAQPLTLRVGTASDLAELCGTNPKDPAADAKINFCHGFAQGAIDVELRRAAGDKKPFCFPSPTPSRGATMTEFVNWVRALPDHRSMGAVEGLFRFLGERFPCK